MEATDPDDEDEDINAIKKHAQFVFKLTDGIEQEKFAEKKELLLQQLREVYEKCAELSRERMDFERNDAHFKDNGKRRRLSGLGNVSHWLSVLLFYLSETLADEGAGENVLDFVCNFIAEETGKV